MDTPKNYMLLPERVFSDDDCDGQSDVGSETSSASQRRQVAHGRKVWLVRHGEQIEAAYLALRAYLSHWRYDNILQKMTYDDFAVFAYKHS